MINQLIADALQQRGRGAASQLARDVGVRPQTVTKWTKGEVTPERDRLADIELALDMPPGELLAAGGYVDVPAGSILDRLDRIERMLGLAPEQADAPPLVIAEAAATGRAGKRGRSVSRPSPPPEPEGP